MPVIKEVLDIMLVEKPTAAIFFFFIGGFLGFGLVTRAIKFLSLLLFWVSMKLFSFFTPFFFFWQTLKHFVQQSAMSRQDKTIIIVPKTI